MTTTQKITGLSRLNVKAIKEVPAVRELFTEVTATTATLRHPADFTAQHLHDIIFYDLPGRGHPRASLHAVLRRIRALPQPEPEPEYRRLRW